MKTIDELRALQAIIAEAHIDTMLYLKRIIDDLEAEQNIPEPPINGEHLLVVPDDADGLAVV